MTMRKQAGQTKKNTTTAAHKTTRRSAGTKTAAKSTPSKKASANTGLISDLDCYLFGAGTHYEIYKKLGAHPMTYKGKKGIYFGVWAPHAQAVHLVGDFNGWNPEANPMTKVGQSGIWEYFNAGMQVGELYKLRHYHPVRQDSLQGRSLCLQRGIPSGYSLCHSRYPGLFLD